MYQIKKTDPAQTVIKYMVIFSIVFVLLMVLFFVAKKEKFSRKDLSVVLFFSIVFQLTLLPSQPDLSDDIYRYIWDGKLQDFKINPYAYAPDDPLLTVYHSKELPALVNFPHIKTIYPPLSQLIFRLSYILFGESVTGMKFLFILFQLGSCLVFYLLLLERGQNPLLILLFAWNPLVVMETSVNGHLDIVMVFFLLLSLFFFYRHRYILSGIAFASAVLSKLIPIILLPLFLLYLFKKGVAPPTQDATQPADKSRNSGKVCFFCTFLQGINKKRGGLRKSGSFLTAFLLTIASFYALYLGSAINMFLTALNYSSKWYFNNPLFHIIHFLVKSNPLAHLISFSLFVVGFLVIFVSSLSFEKKIFYAAFAFVFLNPTIHPWYLILLVGLLCIYQWDVVILWSGVVILSYTVVYRFKLTGEWTDSWIQLVLQYTPLLILALIPFFKRKKM